MTRGVCANCSGKGCGFCFGGVVDNPREVVALPKRRRWHHSTQTALRVKAQGSIPRFFVMAAALRNQPMFKGPKS